MNANNSLDTKREERLLISLCSMGFPASESRVALKSVRNASEKSDDALLDAAVATLLRKEAEDFDEGDYGQYGFEQDVFAPEAIESPKPEPTTLRIDSLLTKLTLQMDKTVKNIKQLIPPASSQNGSKLQTEPQQKHPVADLFTIGSSGSVDSLPAVPSRHQSIMKTKKANMSPKRVRFDLPTEPGASYSHLPFSDSRLISPPPSSLSSETSLKSMPISDVYMSPASESLEVSGLILPEIALPRLPKKEISESHSAEEVCQQPNSNSASSSSSQQRKHSEPTPPSAPANTNLAAIPYNLHEIYSYYQSRCVVHGEMPLEPLVHQIEAAITLNAVSDHLTTLDLTGVLINDKNVWSLKDLLGEQFGLRQLCLVECGLQDGIVKELCGALETSQSLSWISFCGNRKVRREGVKCISRLVRKLRRRLRYLDLSGMYIDEQGFTMLAKSVSYSGEDDLGPHCLEILKLDGCRLRNSELNALAMGLAQSNITYLNLRNNNIPFDCAPALANLLNLCDYGSKSLQYLDLRGNNLRHSLGTLTRALMGNTSLISLNLKDNRLESASIDELADMLAVNRCLKHINLSGNNLGRDGPRSSSALKRLFGLKGSVLQELEVADANLGTDCIVAIVEVLSAAIHDQMSLRRLDLKNNPMGSRGAVALLDLVRTAKYLINVTVFPVYDSKGGLLGDPDVAVLCSRIADKCSYNRDMMVAKREKRASVVDLDEVIPLDPNEEDGLHCHANAKHQGQFSDLEELHSKEDLRSQEIINSAENQQNVFSKQLSAESMEFEEPGQSFITENRDKFSLLKFQHEILEAEERCIILEEMMNHVQICVAGGSTEGLAVDGDVMQELYNATKRFKPTLERAIREGSIEEEETLCAALGLNDRLEESLTIYDYVTSALAKHEDLGDTTVVRKNSGSNRHMDSLKAKRQAESGATESQRNQQSSASGPHNKLDRSVTNTSKSSSPGDSLTKSEKFVIQAAVGKDTRAIPASLVSAERVINDVMLLSDDDLGAAQLRMKFVTGSCQQPPAMISTESSSRLSSPVNTLQRRKDSVNTVVDSDEFPVIPAAQLLYVGHASESGSSLKSDMKTALPPPKKIKKSFSVSSFDDVAVGQEVTTTKTYMDDSFLAELDSQMKEIDEFLSSASLK
ncbi:hypothetical protein BDR26DRAFT_866766 [Obelidium mucronatum]|nr:hypothetical protein BDR26DRAFT_866766 [Obelidium mucronatum]